MRTNIDTQPAPAQAGALQGNKLPKFTALVAVGTLILGACGSDNDNEPALSVGEQIVTDQGAVDESFCANKFAEDDSTFMYALDDDGLVVDAGSTDYDTEVERKFVPQSIAAFFPVDYAKAAAGEAGFRAWGDAISTPVAGNNLSEKNISVFEKMCKDPLYLEHIVAGFSNVTGTSGEPLKNNNEWMQGHTVDSANENAQANYWNYADFDQTSQVGSTLSNAEIVDRMNNHELLAATMATMIETYFSADRFEEGAVAMYHIGLDGPVVPENGELPELTDDLPLYEGNFMVYKYTNKDGRCVEVAINLGDGRFAELVDNVCIQRGDITTTTISNPVPHVPETPGTPTTTPGTPETPTPTTTPETPTPTTTPGTPTTTPDTTTTTLPMHDPAIGPPPEAVIPPQPGTAARTPGYAPGGAEATINQQNSERTGGLNPTRSGTPAGGPGGSPGSGQRSVISEPGSGGANNGDYQPGTASDGTRRGTANDSQSDQATVNEVQTGIGNDTSTVADDRVQTSSGDIGLPG